jgi:ATP-dependent Clp protease ATP-binding subunit ClpA
VFTQQAATVLDSAIREALPLGKNYIATEHVLLSIVRDHEGRAFANLIRHELNVGRPLVYEELKRVLGIERLGPDQG